MRELLRVAALRVDIRRFLGYGFTERLPVHQTISHAQTRRFVDARLFELSGLTVFQLPVPSGGSASVGREGRVDTADDVHHRRRRPRRPGLRGLAARTEEGG
jgi:hypothetical protein